eukprot:Skav226736  [mRNA]  locus=scaffold720:351807:354260:- [translate_table: standard]
MFLVKTRYDETPSKLRVATDDGDSFLLPKSTGRGANKALLKQLGISHKHVRETGVHSKVLQTELHVGMLLEDVKDGTFQWTYGECPTSLAVVDRTTGENTRAVVWDAIQSIPEVERIWGKFEFCIRHSTTDLAASNIRAEAGLQQNMPSFTPYHLACDVHRLATAISTPSSICESDVSGILSVALGTAELGSAKTMRDILHRIFSESLHIEYGPPPLDEHVDRYRKDIFELFLPTNDQPAPTRKMNLKRRFLLGSLLNGNITEGRIIHYCPVGCCNDGQDTISNFSVFCTWALVPHQFPVYSRKSWNNYDKAIDALAILEAHHGLLSQVMDIYLGSIKDPLPAQQATMSQPGVLPLASEPTTTDQDQAQEPTCADPGDPVDWAAIKRAKKRDARVFLRSKPYPRLAVMKEVLQPLLLLMAYFLHLSDHKWNVRQRFAALQGNQRSYAVLEAAKGDRVLSSAKTLLTILHRNMKGVVPDQATCKLRSLRFRMASSGICALHALIRRRHKGVPFQLYKALLGECDHVLSFPTCMQDSLSNMFLNRFNTAELLVSSTCRAMLETLATTTDLDIAKVECLHSTNREFCLLRSRGWTPSLESIAAKAAFRHTDPAKHMVWTKAADDETAATVQKPWRAPKPRRGGGGAWRAFVHAKCKGQKLHTFSELAEAYRNLSDAELSLFKQAGEEASRAHKQGMDSFCTAGTAPTLEIPSSAEPGCETTDLAVFAGDTLTQRYVDMKGRLKLLKDPMGALSKDERDEYSKFVASAPKGAIMRDLHKTGQTALADRCEVVPASSQSIVTGMDWHPPIARVVQVAWLGNR